MSETLRVLASGSTCDDGDCPTLWTDPATGDVVVQGYVQPDGTLRLPDGEGAVRIPAATWVHMLEQLQTR